MKKLIVALALASTAAATPALAADVGIAISIGEPGFYGQLVIGGVDRPRLLNSRPVEAVHRYHNLAPIYLRVPEAQRRNWKHYCDRYNACARPVYFVRDDWYRNDYAPRYRKEHGYDKHEDRGNGRASDHDKGRDNGKGHDNGKGRDRNDRK